MYKKLKKFAEESGYTKEAIRAKIKKGVWQEGVVWRKAPDKQILISEEGYNAWVESGSEFVKQVKAPSKSHLHTKVSCAGSISSSSPPPLT